MKYKTLIFGNLYKIPVVTFLFTASRMLYNKFHMIAELQIQIKSVHKIYYYGCL